MALTTANRLSGVGEYYFSRKLGEIAALNAAGASVINLGIGSPDLPPHPDVIRALQTESVLPQVHAYQGYRGADVLRQAMAAWYARWYGVRLHAASEILPLMGSKEGILHLCMTYLNEGDRALVPNPGYPTYRSAVQLAGAEAVEYLLHESSGWMPDLGAIETQLRLNRVRILFANFPHMPTGAPADEGVMQQLVDLARKYEVLIVHDNPYSFIRNERPRSMLSLEGARDCVVELNSLSKSHNLAGWRVGMLCGEAQRINEVLRFKSNMDSGMFLPLQRAAAVALGLDEHWFSGLNDVYRKREQKAGALLDLLQCRYAPRQQGLFLWARVPAAWKDGYALSDAVLQGARVFLTPGGIFGSQGDPFVRVSLCSAEDVFDEAIERIKNNKL